MMKALWNSKKGYSSPEGEIVEVVKIDMDSGKNQIRVSSNSTDGWQGGFYYWVDPCELTGAGFIL